MINLNRKRDGRVRWCGLLQCASSRKVNKPVSIHMSVLSLSTFYTRGLGEVLICGAIGCPAFVTGTGTGCQKLENPSQRFVCDGANVRAACR
jgi:hypothetical protein